MVRGGDGGDEKDYFILSFIWRIDFLLGADNLVKVMVTDAETIKLYYFLAVN